MGNYVFETSTLIDIVTPRDDTYTDIGGHVIPALTRSGVAHVYDFSTNVVPGQDERERGYWRDVGTIDAYFAANMDLIAPVPVFNLYNDRWPVFTYRGAEPPAKVSRGAGRRAGVRRRQPAVPGLDRVRAPTSSARSSVPACYVHHDAHVTESILFPGVRVEQGARLHRCIVDKNVQRPGVVPHRPRPAADDREQYTVSDERRRRHREGPQARLIRRRRCASCRRRSDTGRADQRHEDLREARHDRPSLPVRAATTGANGSIVLGPTMM